MSRLLVIIVTYNAMRWIERCFASLAASTVASDIFVVDNGSTDGTLDWLQEHRADNLTLRRSASNCGFGAGNNLGLSYALAHGYDYVYLLNQDAWVMPDCFEKLIVAARTHPGYGILSPLQLQADGVTPDRLFEKHCGKSIERSGAAGVVPVKFVMAAHWLVTRECLEVTGGFSPTFPQYGEDDNYIDRARYWAFRTGVVPAAKAIHDRGQRPAKREAQMRGKYLGCVARLSDPGRRHVWLHLAMECLRIVGMALRRLSPAMLLYLPRLVRSMPLILRNRSASFHRRAFLGTSP